MQRNTQRSELWKQTTGKTSDSYTTECFKSVVIFYNEDAITSIQLTVNTFPVFFVTDPPVGLECSSSCPQKISSLEFLLPFVCPVATRQPTNCRPKPFTFHYCSIPGMLQPIMQEPGDNVTQRHQDETILGHWYALAPTWMGVGLQMAYNLEVFSHYYILYYNLKS